MTGEGLRHRWNDLRERLHIFSAGLPHGVNQFVDIDRRLTRTTIQTIFDVGANRGQSAVALRRWFPRASIHSFEPVPDTFLKLQVATAGLGIRTYALGFSNVARVAMIATPAGSDSMSALGPGSSEEAATAVTLDTLDAFCARHSVRQIDYLKIDTEGHDLDVLQGARRMLEERRAALIQVEAGLHPDNRFHVAASDLSSHLIGYGYRLFGIYEQTLEWTTADAYLRRADMVFAGPEAIEHNRFRTDVVPLQT